MHDIDGSEWRRRKKKRKKKKGQRKGKKLNVSQFMSTGL